MIDIITITHSATNEEQCKKMLASLQKHEDGNYNFILRDNSVENFGFAKGCNWGAKQAKTDILGFLNPDTTVHGKFIETVEKQFKQDDNLVIVGSTFGTKKSSYSHLGLHNWVCGAAFFVRRDWFESVGGFWEGYVWSWEETDLCRQAQQLGKGIKAIDALLPITHDGTPPGVQSDRDSRYKTKHFNRGKRLYNARWRNC
jgi:GT2 family glycosyltransferase